MCSVRWIRWEASPPSQPGIRAPTNPPGAVSTTISRAAITELVGKLQKLPRVPGHPHELGDDEAGDVAAFEAGKHPSGFGVIIH